MRRVVLIVAVAVALAGLAGNGRADAQEGGFGSNPIGEPVPIYNVDGDEVALVTVDEVIDPFEDFEDFGEPAEGERFVLTAITVENTGERPYEFTQYDFYLLDSLGRAAYANFVSRTADSIDDHPDLESTNMNPGETVSGAVLYRIADDAEIAQIYYSFYGDVPQLYPLADLSDGSRGATADDEDDQAEETPDTTDEEDGDSTDAGDSADDDDADDDSANAGAIEATEENCAWAADTLDRLSALQPVGAELQDMDDDIDVERLREIADQLADGADAQRESDPPAAAEEASDQIADALDTYADALDEVADAVEADEVVDTTALLADVQDANALIEEAGAVTAPLLEACTPA